LSFSDASVDDASIVENWADTKITEENLVDYSRHHFSVDDGFTPEKIEVNGRKGRRVVCVLGADRLHYKMFDLDSAVDTAAEAEDEEEEADESMMSQ
jgi:anaphase-promoting complex subunit 4